MFWLTSICTQKKGVETIFTQKLLNFTFINKLQVTHWIKHDIFWYKVEKLYKKVFSCETYSNNMYLKFGK